MSDFLFSTRQRPPGELQSALARYLSHVSVATDERHGAWGSLAVARAYHDPPDVLVDDGKWLSVLAGEPIVHAAGLPAAASRVEDRRMAVHRLLQSGPATAWEQSLDGAFAALAIDTASGGGTVLTDLMAFVPIFVARGVNGGQVVGTHPDAVARAAGRGRDIDLVSAVDFAIHWASAFPYTLYRGVEQFPPAAVRRWSPDGEWEGDARPYWLPLEQPNPYRSLDDAAAALRDAVLDDVHAGCEGFGEVGVLMSGGEDARAVLAAVPRGVRVRSFVFADWENREVRVARAAARAYGAECTFGRRGADHYVDGMEAVASMIGSQNLFMDVHGWGLHERLGIRELPRVFGGFSADSLLKGGYTPSRPGPVRLRQLSGLRPELVAEAAARNEAHRRRIAELRPGSAGEWYRLWPFSMRRHSANVDGNRRLFASHEPFHATAVIKLAAAVPGAWKQNRRLFHAAMKPLFRRSWYLPHSRWRFPYFGNAANVPLSAGLRVTRGARALLTGQLRARHQPWPRWSSVARSAAAERIGQQRPPWDSPLRGMFADASGAELAAGVRSEWHALGELMLMQLAYLAERTAEDG